MLFLLSFNIIVIEFLLKYTFFAQKVKIPVTGVVLSGINDQDCSEQIVLNVFLAISR